VLLMGLEIVVLLIVVCLLLRQLQERRVKISRLWILPVLVLYLTLRSIIPDLFLTPWSPMIILLACLVGVLIGILRGNLVRVRFDGHPGEMMVKGSPVGVAVWVVLIIMKYFVHSFFGSGANGYHSTNLVTAALLAMTAGTIIARRVVLYLKYREAVGKRPM
jgi:hypothetical protein